MRGIRKALMKREKSEMKNLEESGEMRVNPSLHKSLQKTILQLHWWWYKVWNWEPVLIHNQLCVYIKIC